MKKILFTITLLIVCACVNAWAQDNIVFRHLSTQDGLPNDEVKAIVRDGEGYVWITTATGLCRYDGYRFKTFASEPNGIGGLRHDARKVAKGYCVSDRSGGTWMFSTLNDSIFYKRKGEKKWRQINLYDHNKNESNSTRAIEDDGRGNVWIATDHRGIFIFSKATGKITNIRHDDKNSSSLAEDNVATLYLDPQGAMWVGYLKKGLSYYHPSFSKFSNVVTPQFANISAIEESHDGSLWIGTDGNGLYRRLTSGQIEKVEIPADIVVTLMEDSAHRLWIGTYQHGLICYDKGNTKTFTTNDCRLSDNSIYALCQDRKGRIWIGSLWGYMQCFDPANNSFTDFKSKSKDQSIAQSMSYDGGNNLYAGMLSGLCVIDIYNGKRKMYCGNQRGTQKFLQPNIQAVYRDSRGLLWLGHNKGISIFDMKRDTIYYLDKSKGLVDDIVRGIAEDGNHRLWVATSNGCTAISVASLKGNVYSFTMSNYTTNDGLPTNNFSRNSILRLRNGNILIGGIGGFTTVDMKRYVDGTSAMKFPGKPVEDKPIDWWIIVLSLLPLLIAAVIIYIMSLLSKENSFDLI